ncbi:MAG: hypothetical protein NC035_09225 [Bacteroides sp.]|nr:hypothetical protein [Bacteroides sp.]
MSTISIPKGNDFNLFFPLALLTDQGTLTLSVDDITDIHITIGKGSVLTEYAYSTESTLLYIAFDENLERATYDVHIAAKYNGRDIASHLKSCFRIVDWNSDANISNYFPKQSYTAETSVFIGNLTTNTDIEAVKAEYRAKIAELERVKEEYNAAKDNFSSENLRKLIDSAKEEILTAISAIETEGGDEIATEDIDSLFH